MKLGIRPERLQLEWISAAEGIKCARVLKEIEKTMKVLSMNEGKAKAKVKRQR